LEQRICYTRAQRTEPTGFFDELNVFVQQRSENKDKEY
jgi:hypothetical protein